MDILKILSALPHRYPFLLVDRVVEVVKGDHIHAYKNVTFNEEFFQGHFPGKPVMPGVLQLEAMAQAGALLAYEGAPFDPSQKVIYLMSFDAVKFRRPVVPGDRLDLHVRIERQKGAIWRLAGEAKVDGQPASEAQMISSSLREHIILTVSAIGFGLLIALPLGVAAARWFRWEE